MSALSWYLIGVVSGLILKEFLPPDIVNKIGKIKLKNSDSNQVEIPFNEQPQKKGLLKRIFKRNKS